MRGISALVAVALGFGSWMIQPLTRSAAGQDTKSAGQTQADWPVYGGQDAQDHYSSLSQINRGNVNKLVLAWKFDSGEEGGLETNPLVVGRALYAYTPSQKIIALDAVTGKLLWKFNSGIPGTSLARGVAYWTDGHQGRILAAVMNYLYCLDARTGKPVPSFGTKGRIDLRNGLGENSDKVQYALTSPGIIYKNLIIVGGRVPETHPAPRVDIRAFDVRSGALRWSFHTVPRPGEFGSDTWPKDGWKIAGGANNWAGMALDAKRGIVYAPTGSAVFDFYGGDRAGDDLFANTLLALDAETGKRIWHFQGVHHDIWDRDFPSPPTLMTVTRDGKAVDAVAQTTKAGWLYVFDRTNGQPLFPIEERPVPPSHIPGETTSPTQPIPTLPEPYTQQSVTTETLTNRTPATHAWAVRRFKSYITGEQYLPVSVNKMTVMMPGLAGGGEWGGSAADPTTGVIYINANDTAWLVGITVPPVPRTLGERLYQNQCSVCHGTKLAGSPPAIPSLMDVGRRMTDEAIKTRIHHGGGRMPAFNDLNDAQVGALLLYLKNSVPAQKATTQVGKVAHAADATKVGMPYKFMGFIRFLDPQGYPATAPPWGTLSAIDLNTGKYLWKIPFGEYPELVATMGKTGSDNYGGPVVTAGGLLFIGASVFDQKFHAFDSSTGKLLWETRLPYSGLATPATYMVDG
ncbi:MAG TPA: PQQ-binding-like beta-propeller repeat protein, partial [Acidobacteriaceae bacterium]